MSQSLDRDRYDWVVRVLGVFPSKGKPTNGQDDEAKLLEGELDDSLTTLEKIRGKDAYGKNEKGSLAEVRAKVDDLRFAWPELEDKARRMDPKDGKASLQNMGKIIEGLWNNAHDAPFVGGKPEDEKSLRGLVIFDCKLLDGYCQEALKSLDERRTGDRTGYVNDKNQTEAWNQSAGKYEYRDDSEWAGLREKDVRMGDLTGKVDGQLVEGWNATTKKYEYHHPDEWEHFKQREGIGLGNEIKMTALGSGGVHIQPHKGTDKLPLAPVFERLLKQERDTTAELRKKLSEEVNKRTGGAEEDRRNNCEMAARLTKVLETNPDLLKDGGLFGRIVGNSPGQGQHVVDKNNLDSKEIVKNINEASKRLAEGQGQPDDANMVLQFIGCFVDGLTEVNEGKNPAADQFKKIRNELCVALKIQPKDLDALMTRVEGFKEIANGVADTGMGKGARKKYTRKSDNHDAAMPESPEWQINDEDALIKNDISGSMHSCLLAQEFSESLVGGKGIKGKGESVKVEDLEKLNARVVDALALTAGARVTKKDQNGKEVHEENVLHTAYEMINGMRAITGMPEIDQMTATQIMILLGKGKTFTDAVETIFPPKKLPWFKEVPN
jgi:hypothetical protein